MERDGFSKTKLNEIASQQCDTVHSGNGTVDPTGVGTSRATRRLKRCGDPDDHHDALISAKGGDVSVIIWLPAMFLLGLAGMGLCIAFLKVCENI